MSLQHATDPVVHNPHFLQMSMTVLVAAMVDFVSPLRYRSINDRPFASDKFNLSIDELGAAGVDAAEQLKYRIECLQEVKMQCDRLKHINTRKNPSDVSSRRACYFGIVDLALHACWYSMCKPGEERCKYNIPIPQNQALQTYLPFETYFPLKREDPSHEMFFEYEETSKIVERWSCGLLFLNKVMLPSLSMFSDPSSKAARVFAVSSICNFLRTSAYLDASLFKFLFIRDIVADHRACGKVSACHLLLEAAAACIDLEPEVSLNVHNKAVFIENEEELDDEETVWFPYKLLHQNFRAHVEYDSDFFGMSRLCSTFRLMKSLCSLSLLSAGTRIQHPMDPASFQPPSMFDSEQLEMWLNELNNLPSEKCPVKLSFQSDNDEDSEYFRNPYFLICYMMICKESIRLDKMAEFQNDVAAQEDFFCNHFIKVLPQVHELHFKPNAKLLLHLKDPFELNHARDFSAQFFSQTFFDFEDEDFKYEFTNPNFNHERMVSNWIDFLSAYVELNSKKLSCPCYDVSEIEDRDELEMLMDSLKDLLSVDAEPNSEKHCHKRIFNHMKTLFDQQHKLDPEMHYRWFNMIDPKPKRAPFDASEITKARQHANSNPHPLDMQSTDDSQYGGISCLCICVSFWIFPYTTTPMKASLVRYLRCYMEGMHHFHQHLTKTCPQENSHKVKELEKVKELAVKKCQWLLRLVDRQPESPPEELFAISAMRRDFEKREWSHTIELLKLLRVMLVFEVEHFTYIHQIIDFLWSRLKNISLLDDENYHIMFQRFEVLYCFASILADLCESFDPADYFLTQQRGGGNSGFYQFRYAILRQVCSSQFNREPLCCVFLRVLSLVSRHTHYTQLMPAALASLRLLLTAHERQKELSTLRASDRFICRPFEEDSLDSFDAIMISNLAVPYLLCAAGHMEIRTFPALSLFMSCLHSHSHSHSDLTPRKNPCSHRVLLEFPKQLCSWASSSTLLSLSNSVLLLSSSMLLLSRILEDAAQSIPNLNHGILLQIMPSPDISPSYRCGPALGRIDQTLSFVVDTLLEQDGYGFFNFHSHLMVRNPELYYDDFHLSTPLIHQWIFFPSGHALSKPTRRLSKFLTCQSLVHRNILIGDFFCQFSFECAPLNVFGTFHPFQLQVFDQQECQDAIFQKLMDVGSDRSHECVKGNFSSGANTLVNFIALLQALTCVSVNSISDMLRTCPSKTESSHCAPSLAHILLNHHAMYSHSVVDDNYFNVFDDYHASRLLFSLLTQIKDFCTVPNETQRFEILNHRYVWLLPILSRSWEIIANLLDDPFSRLICTHVIQIFRVPGETWLWGSNCELGHHEVDVDARHTSLSALIDCASFLNYFLKMNSNLNPSHPWEEVIDLNGFDVQFKYLNSLHDLLSHGMHAISWSVKALKSMVWIVSSLCPERFSYDFRGLVDVWHWAEGRHFWNRMFVGNFLLDEPQDPDDDNESTMSSNDEQPCDHTLVNSIRHVVESRSSFVLEQQLFELLLRCQNNEFDDFTIEARRGPPDWFENRLKEWYLFEDKRELGEVLSAGLSIPVDLSKEWETLQNKASKLNISLLSSPASSYLWKKSCHDMFRLVDRRKLELVHLHSDPGSGSLLPNQDEAFKSISLHALHFNHALSLKSSKCHLAQSLGSLFAVIFSARNSSDFDMGAIYQRDEILTCVVFIDFALRLCLFLRDWLVAHLQADFTLQFLKAARIAIIRLKSISDAAKESFLQQHRSLFLKISENICQIIISKNSHVNQSAAIERKQLYVLLLEYLSAFDCNHSGYQGSDFVLRHILCCDEQRYLPLAFYTILRDLTDANNLQSIEAMMLLARLLQLMPATIAIVNVIASSVGFSSPLIHYVDGPLSQNPLFSSVFYSRCSLLCRVVQRNPSLIAPVLVAMRQIPFFVERGSFCSIISSQQSSQHNIAQFADQVIAFHLIADSVMSIISRCAFTLDALSSFAASEGLLELLHFLHFSFYQSRAGNGSQNESWLLKILRHFSGSRDPYLEYLTRRHACLPAPYMRPFSSLATTLYGQVSAAVLSLAVLQRHRVRNWSGSIPWLNTFHVADKEIPQILVNISLLDVSVCSVDILELPRDKFSHEDIEYDGMMAAYQYCLPSSLFPHPLLLFGVL
jgi:hypothetical protein